MTETLAGKAVRGERSRAVMEGDELRFPNREDPPFRERKKNEAL